MSYIETHCHLDYLKQAPIDELLDMANKAQVENIITITVSPDNLDTVLKIAKTHDNVFCSQGIHPHEAKDMTPEVLDKIKVNASKEDKVVAIGEIGLDYHYNHSPRDIQIKWFQAQLELAVELNMPVIIHSRDADEDMYEILKSVMPRLKKKGVIHSYTSSLKLAKYAIDAGFYLGFNGIITFKSAKNVREVLEITPIEQILTETDAPFLAPVPHRGKENAPHFLPHVVDMILEVKNLDKDFDVKVFKQNAKNLFGI